MFLWEIRKYSSCLSSTMHLFSIPVFIPTMVSDINMNDKRVTQTVNWDGLKNFKQISLSLVITLLTNSFYCVLCVLSLLWLWLNILEFPSICAVSSILIFLEQLTYEYSFKNTMAMCLKYLSIVLQYTNESYFSNFYF